MFYSCSSLISLPDISKWNLKNIKKLESIFENCSLLTFLPNISKWKFKNKVKINRFIFKGCNSLLIIPDISKWNIINENINYSSFSSNSISIKEIKSNSLLPEEYIIEYHNLYEDSQLLENPFPDNKNSENFSKNNELDDYYDNFYN